MHKNFFLFFFIEGCRFAVYFLKVVRSSHDSPVGLDYEDEVGGEQPPQHRRQRVPREAELGSLCYGGDDGDREGQAGHHQPRHQQARDLLSATMDEEGIDDHIENAQEQVHPQDYQRHLFVLCAINIWVVCAVLVPAILPETTSTFSQTYSDKNHSYQGSNQGD